MVLFKNIFFKFKAFSKATRLVLIMIILPWFSAWQYIWQPIEIDNWEEDQKLELEIQRELTNIEGIIYDNLKPLKSKSPESGQTREEKLKTLATEEILQEGFSFRNFSPKFDIIETLAEDCGPSYALRFGLDQIKSSFEDGATLKKAWDEQKLENETIKLIQDYDRGHTQRSVNLFAEFSDMSVNVKGSATQGTGSV